MNLTENLTRIHVNSPKKFFCSKPLVNSRSHIFHTVQGKVAKIVGIRDTERDEERQRETEGDRKKHMKVNDSKEKSVVAESESSQRSSHIVTTMNYIDNYLLVLDSYASNFFSSPIFTMHLILVYCIDYEKKEYEKCVLMLRKPHNE